MNQVIQRRLKRGLREENLPDLIVVDGGLGQLGAAQAAFEALSVNDVDLISLAKSRLKGEGRRSPERVFLPGYAEPVVLQQDSRGLLLLTRIRDEAHRFAINYHRKKRARGSLASVLDGIPGIGPHRKKMLLVHFGSLRSLEEASVEKIAEAPSISVKLANLVFEHLAKNRARDG